MEIWKDIKGYEGLYQVSSEGRVKSLGGGDRYKVTRLLNGYVGNNGYRVVTMWKNGSSKLKTIHRLVAETFIDNPENKPQVDHMNTIRTDNRICNLRWVTYKENSNNETTKLHMSDAQKISCKKNERDNLGRFRKKNEINT